VSISVSACPWLLISYIRLYLAHTPGLSRLVISRGAGPGRLCWRAGQDSESLDGDGSLVLGCNHARTVISPGEWRRRSIDLPDWHTYWLSLSLPRTMTLHNQPPLCFFPPGPRPSVRRWGSCRGSSYIILFPWSSIVSVTLPSATVSSRIFVAISRGSLCKLAVCNDQLCYAYTTLSNQNRNVRMHLWIKKFKCRHFVYR
jgi:hypothetical protein